MSTLDYVRQGMRLVLSKDGLTDLCQYRKLTSKASAEPRTYGDWLDITGLFSQGKTSQVFDVEKNVYKDFTNASFRTADTEPALDIGDQVMDSAGLSWAVAGVLSSGPGSIAYSMAREIGLIASRDRKGGK